jgi:hypothetical protein
MGSESPGYPGVIAARYDLDETPTDLGMDDDSRSLNVNLRVWNTNTLSWERMVSPDAEAMLTRGILSQLLDQLQIMNTHLQILTDEEIEEIT